MNTQFSTKLAALAVALVMNTLMIGTVSALFNGHIAPWLPDPVGAQRGSALRCCLSVRRPDAWGYG